MKPGPQFEQLPMFMTAREIRDNYAPVDRQYGIYNRLDDSTYRIHPGNTVDRATGRLHSDDEMAQMHLTSQYGDLATPQDEERWQTDDELWTEKERAAHVKSPVSDSLFESVAKHGVVNPVQLSLNPRSAREGEPEGNPSVGQRVVLGGHHRVAAQHEIDPDALMPVEHTEQTNVDDLIDTDYGGDEYRYHQVEDVPGFLGRGGG